MTEETPTQENIVELPTLDARYLEVIHAVMGAALLESATFHMSLHGAKRRPQVTEKFLRKLSIELVKQAREIYNQPHQDRVARFQAILNHISNEMHGIAKVMTEDQAREDAEKQEEKPVLYNPLGEQIITP